MIHCSIGTLSRRCGDALARVLPEDSSRPLDNRFADRRGRARGGREAARASPTKLATVQTMLLWTCLPSNHLCCACSDHNRVGKAVSRCCRAVHREQQWHYDPVVLPRQAEAVDQLPQAWNPCIPDFCLRQTDCLVLLLWRVIVCRWASGVGCS